MIALLVVLAAWFALSVPVALFMGRFIRVGQTHAPEVPTTDRPGPRDRGPSDEVDRPLPRALMLKRVIHDAGNRRSDSYMPNDAEPLSWIAHVLKDAPTATSVNIVDQCVTREQAGTAPTHRGSGDAVTCKTLPRTYTQTAGK
jgi:hypothetical protein